LRRVESPPGGVDAAADVIPVTLRAPPGIWWAARVARPCFATGKRRPRPVAIA
jgi:hypothetical protein